MLVMRSRTENLPMGNREGKACGETVRPNLNGNQGRHVSSNQETPLVRVGISSPFRGREDVKCIRRKGRRVCVAFVGYITGKVGNRSPTNLLQRWPPLFLTVDQTIVEYTLIIPWA